MIAAGGFALAELASGLLIGQFLERGRAEPALFLAFRPWLLLILALVAARLRPGSRASLYGLALVLASGSEVLLVAGLGAPPPLVEAARAVLAGLALAAVLDGVVRVARWAGRRLWPALGLALGIGLLAMPGPLMLFERLALGLPGNASPAGARPELLILSGLPLIWGEGGVDAALHAGAQPAAYKLLARDFDTVPIDSPEQLRSGRHRLLFAAQPRRLTPGELTALDAWVRAGGRVLILADPDLRWPSEFALGDPRRPPVIQALGPLLAHWGLRLETRPPAIVIQDFPAPGGVRRVVMDAPGVFVATGAACRTFAAGRAAECRPGSGRALLLADADLLDDRLWAGPGAGGASRLARAADNVLLIAEWLDDLAGNRRDRQIDSIVWRTAPHAFPALAVALIPVAAILLLGILLVRLRPTR